MTITTIILATPSLLVIENLSKPSRSSLFSLISKDQLISRNVPLFINNYSDNKLDDRITIETKNLIPVSVAGNQSGYSFDDYSKSLDLLVPVSDATIQEDFSDSHNIGGWNTRTLDTTISRSNETRKQLISHLLQAAYGCGTDDIGIEFKEICDPNNYALYNISFSLARTHTIYAVIIPLYAIFFLLGISLVFDRERITDRLTITFGVFILIFALPQLIDSEKPLTFGEWTVADYVMMIVVLVAVTYTIFSVLSYKLKSNRIEMIGVIDSIVTTVVFLLIGWANLPGTILDDNDLKMQMVLLLIGLPISLALGLIVRYRFRKRPVPSIIRGKERIGD